jgi:hypothetical protein
MGLEAVGVVRSASIIGHELLGAAAASARRRSEDLTLLGVKKRGSDHTCSFRVNLDFPRLAGGLSEADGD